MRARFLVTAGTKCKKSKHKSSSQPRACDPGAQFSRRALLAGYVPWTSWWATRRGLGWFATTWWPSVVIKQILKKHNSSSVVLLTRPLCREYSLCCCRTPARVRWMTTASLYVCVLYFTAQMRWLVLVPLAVTDSFQTRGVELCTLLLLMMLLMMFVYLIFSSLST